MGITLDEYYGQLGPIRALLEDPTVTEIMVNGPSQIFAEVNGKLVLTNIRYETEEELEGVIRFIAAAVGRHIDEQSPMLDARLMDGSRVNAVFPPLSLKGSMLTIRKFAKDPLQVSDLVRMGSCSQVAFDFLQAAVLARANLVVSGGTGSGKTTFLNVLSGFIPADQRIITIEDAAELQLRQVHVGQLETRKPDVNGYGEVTVRDLVRNSLRMRPDRIIVGECRGGEALDMLQAMNTGHDGSMTTLHANSPRDALHRLTTLALTSGVELPERAIKQQIAAAINLICQLERLDDGTRRVTAISEVVGMEGEMTSLQDIFKFTVTGATSEGKVQGVFAPTGMRPHILETVYQHDIPVPVELMHLFPPPPGYRPSKGRGRA